MEKKKKVKKAAASSWDILAAEEAPVLMDKAPASEDTSLAPVHITHDTDGEWPRNGAWNSGATSDVPAEPHIAAEEAIPAEEPCLVAPEGASLTDESYIGPPEGEQLPEDASPAEEAVSEEDPMEKEQVPPKATSEASQAELVVEDFNDVEEHHLNQHDNIPHDSYNPYGLSPEPVVAPMHNAPAEDAEFLLPPSGPTHNAVRNELGFHSPPSAPSPIVTSVLETAASEAPMEDGHTIMLKILNGSKVLRSIIFVRGCTQTAILTEARAYCVKRAQDDQSLGTLLANGCNLALVSLEMYGSDMDLSTYQVEDLSSLVRAVEKTGIPRFTLRISEI